MSWSVRRVGRLPLAFVVLVALLLTLLAARAERAEAAPTLGFNENAFLYWSHLPTEENIPERVIAEYSLRAGAKAQRFVLPWADVQPTPTTWNWDRFDEGVAEMRKWGLRPLITLERAPSWAKASCNGGACPPSSNHYDEWGEFAGRVVQRYPDALAIEVWHGPNWKGHWSAVGGANPTAYARMYEAAARRIHAAAPHVPVLVGGLDDAEDQFFGSMEARKFLNRFYNQVDRGVIWPQDGVAIRAFPDAEDRRGLGGRLGRFVNKIRGVIAQRDPGRGIWMTEAGQTTSGPLGASEVGQSRAIEVLLDWARARENRDIKAVMIHSLFEHWLNPNPNERGWGVVRGPSFRPKVAYCMLVARIAGPLKQARCSNQRAFRVVKTKRNRKRGTAKILVYVPGPGKLRMAKTRKVKGARASFGTAGVVPFKIKPRGKTKKRLRKPKAGRRQAKAKVQAVLTFFPDGAGKAEVRKKVKLIRKRR